MSEKVIVIEDIAFRVCFDYTKGSNGNTGASVLPEDSCEGYPAEVEINEIYLDDDVSQENLISVFSESVISKMIDEILENP